MAVRPLHGRRPNGGIYGTRIHDRRSHRGHDLLAGHRNSGGRAHLRQSAGERFLLPERPRPNRQSSVKAIRLQPAAGNFCRRAQVSVIGAAEMASQLWFAYPSKPLADEPRQYRERTKEPCNVQLIIRASIFAPILAAILAPIPAARACILSSPDGLPARSCSF